MILNGSEVILLSKKANFDFIYNDNVLRIPTSINYLAICQYKNQKSFFVHLCDKKLRVKQTIQFYTLEEAMDYGYSKNRKVIWEEGFRFIDFDQIDFKEGAVEKISNFGEDMLEIYYTNGYMIDIGYIEDIKAFEIAIIKDGDWVNIVKLIQVKTDLDLKMNLQQVISWISRDANDNTVYSLKMKMLKSIAHNIAHSYLSLMNYIDGEYIVVRLFNIAKNYNKCNITIDILRQTIEPIEYETVAIMKSLTYLRDRFQTMLNSERISIMNIQSAKITIQFYLNETKVSSNICLELPNYNCVTEIVDISGKIYTKKVVEWWKY